MAKNNEEIKFEKYINDWGSSSSSAKFLFSGVRTLKKVCEIVGGILFLPMLLLIFEVYLNPLLLKALLILSILLEFTSEAVDFIDIVKLKSISNWIERNKINPILELYDSEKNNNFYVDEDAYCRLTIATNKNQDNFKAQYVLKSIFSSMAGLLFCIGFAIYLMTAINDYTSLITMFGKDYLPENTTSIIFDDWKLPAIIIGVGLVFSIIGVVISSSLFKKCKAWVKKESEKLVVEKDTNVNNEILTNENQEIFNLNSSEKQKEKNIEEKIEELKVLKGKGVITEEQYKEAVQKHLNSL